MGVAEKASVDPTAPDPTKARFGEPLKLLPVAFILTMIGGLWAIYTTKHCLPLMQQTETHVEGMVSLIIFNVVATLLLTNYYCAVMQHPGTIPDKDLSGDASWEYVGEDKGGPFSMESQSRETKRLGDRRLCKWCFKYKPDRCHHCRVCRMCILKMDHHCPWIYNCVGFKNFKYFFLLVVYAVIALHMMTWTMLQTVHKVMRGPDATFFDMFLVLFGETLAGFMGTLLTVFLCFHIYLMLKAMTTIEFCEKSRRPSFETDTYSRQTSLGNVKAVLGDYVVLWLLPLSLPSGDGLSFVTEDLPLRRSKDIEHGRGIRRKAHQDVQPKAKDRRYLPQTAGTGAAPSSDDDPNIDYERIDRYGNGRPQGNAAILLGGIAQDGQAGEASGDTGVGPHIPVSSA